MLKDLPMLTPHITRARLRLDPETGRIVPAPPRRRRVLLVLLGAVFLAGVAAFFLVPWKAWIEKKIITSIEQKGISPVTLRLDSIGLHNLVVKDVSLGEPGLKLASLTLGYSPDELIDGSIENITLGGLAVIATRTNEGWSIAGIDQLLKGKSSGTSTGIPVTRVALAALPVQRIQVTQGSIHAETNGWQIDAEAQLIVENQIPKLTLSGANVTAAMSDKQISTGPYTLQLTLDEAKQQWVGNWSIADIAFESEGANVPKLSAKGEVTIGADEVSTNYMLEDASKTYRAEGSFTTVLSKPELGSFKLTQANIPWGGGSIAARNITVPLVRKKVVTVNLEVQKVAIDTLLQALTSDQATATGVVSGKVPLIIAPNDTIRIGKGALKADAPGVIALSPEAIPGDNAQVALAREVLKNLHYTLLSLELNMGADNALMANLAVTGSNPDVQKGRQVKLQVHLSGDVLNLITQNVKLMTDPKQFIKDAQ